MPEDLHQAAAIERLLELLAIPGGSGGETAVASYLQDALQQATLPADVVTYDTAHTRSPFGGEIGNFVVRLAGQGVLANAPRLMASAHLDTVPLCLGCQPERDGDRIVPAGDTALGADNRSGCAALLTMVLELRRQALAHPPLTLCFFVQEEVGLVGSRHADSELFGQPAFCINVDGGAPQELTHGAIGGVKWNIEIQGRAAHAGVHPRDGISAATVFAMAMHDLIAGGWHGAVDHDTGRGTANIGKLTGGEATNVVMDRLTVTGECRSHDPAFLEQLVSRYRDTFRRAADQVMNADGDTARCIFREENRYPSFCLDRQAEVISRINRGLAVLGLEPAYKISNGGQDANCLNQLHGIPTVTIGAGAHRLHTVHEYLDIAEYLTACRLLIQVATARH